MEKNLRSRCYHLILYPDNEEHVKMLDLIETNYNYAYILHDKDFIADTGELKKAHWHVILYFEHAKLLSALAEELQIAPNYIRTEELRKGLFYLIHRNNKDKYQYSVSEVVGPLTDNLQKYLGTSVESEKTSVLLLFNYINSYEGPIYLQDLLPIIIKEDLWSYFRRSQLTWFKLMDEHNKKYHVASVLKFRK